VARVSSRIQALAGRGMGPRAVPASSGPVDRIEVTDWRARRFL
jgi:hypothetical protein